MVRRWVGDWGGYNHPSCWIRKRGRVSSWHTLESGNKHKEGREREGRRERGRWKTCDEGWEASLFLHLVLWNPNPPHTFVKHSLSLCWCYGPACTCYCPETQKNLKNTYINMYALTSLAHVSSVLDRNHRPRCIPIIIQLNAADKGLQDRWTDKSGNTQGGLTLMGLGGLL